MIGDFDEGRIVVVLEQGEQARPGTMGARSMKRINRTLQAEWSARLKESGFEDLEGAGGLLSNRGTPSHLSDRGTSPHAADEHAEYEAHLENARDIARCHRFPTKLDRRIWTLWAEGVSTEGGRQREEIARQVGVSTRQVRQSIWRTRRAVEKANREEVSPVNPVKARDREKVDRLVRVADPDLLIALALRFA